MCVAVLVGSERREQQERPRSGVLPHAGQAEDSRWELTNQTTLYTQRKKSLAQLADLRRLASGLASRTRGSGARCLDVPWAVTPCSTRGPQQQPSYVVLWRMGYTGA